MITRAIYEVQQVLHVDRQYMYRGKIKGIWYKNQVKFKLPGEELANLKDYYVVTIREDTNYHRLCVIHFSVDGIAIESEPGYDKGNMATKHFNNLTDDILYLILTKNVFLNYEIGNIQADNMLWTRIKGLSLSVTEIIEGVYTFTEK